MKPSIQRMCIVSRKRLPKEALFRLVNVDGALVYDPTYRKEGRGIYVEKSQEALSRFLDPRFLGKRHLPMPNEQERERMANDL